MGRDEHGDRVAAETDRDGEHRQHTERDREEQVRERGRLPDELAARNRGRANDVGRLVGVGEQWRRQCPQTVSVATSRNVTTNWPRDSTAG
ncbi:MAG: hypothetical protein M3046_13680, partial [Actinomycetota bacterium]|nr:hypothetical protein [Actinomycetota bacterium]